MEFQDAVGHGKEVITWSYRCVTHRAGCTKTSLFSPSHGWFTHTHKKSLMFKENLSLSKIERIKLQEPAEFREVGEFQNCCFDLSVGYSLALNHTRLKLRNFE